MYQTFIKPFYQDIKKFVLDTLFPISCLSCGKEGDYICSDCQNKLTVLDHQICIVCQKPSPLGLTHPKCSSPHMADGLISFFDYHDEKVSKIIISGKYYFLPDVYKILGKMVAEKIKTDYPSLIPSLGDGKGSREGSTEWILTPIPLHNWRLRWRGFNQAEVLCKAIGQELRLPYFDVLIRRKSTKIQKDLKKEARIKNVEGCFKLKSQNFPPQAWGGWPESGFPKTPREFWGNKAGRGRTNDDNINTQDNQSFFSIKNKNVFLVDDVTTTGSTLLEAAKVLKRNGAAKVICLTIAGD